MTACGESTVCAYPWQQMIIDLTGEVVPCCFWTGYANSGKPLGNTNESSLDEIWNGPAYQELRKANAQPGGPPEGHPCHQCMAWRWGSETYPKFSWPASFSPEVGHAFVTPLPEAFQVPARLSADDGAGNDGAGNHGAPDPVLFEDGRPLTRCDIHDEIREQGAGRYSIWGDVLYFSASDNTDPVTNGRAYELRHVARAAPADARDGAPAGASAGTRAGTRAETRADALAPDTATETETETVLQLKGLQPDSDSGRNLLTAYDEYRAEATVLASKPSMLSFISTADCNIDCPACSQNTVRLTKVQHRAATEPDVLAHVPFLHQFIWHGGEPYLIRRFREFIDAFDPADNPNLTFGFTSNGTLLDAEELRKLLKFPRINASVSIDSFVKETFDIVRAGARFDRVVENVLQAVSHYHAPDRVFSVGMIVIKSNLLELPVNLAWAIEHDIGLNLSPVVVYPATERLDVFADPVAQTEGWDEALEQALAIVREAKAAGRPAVRRVDPEGMVVELQQIRARGKARYADVVELKVVVEDPDGSLVKMRQPGLLVTIDGQQHQPLAYLETPIAGTYTTWLPRAELSGDACVRWDLVHDLLEPMGLVERYAFLDRDGVPVHESGWRELPTEIALRVPPFEAVARRRNVAVANRGLPTPDGLRVQSPDDIFHAYLRRMEQERAEGQGVKLGRTLGRRHKVGEGRFHKYGRFTELAG